jgi:hypothetical protein
MSKEQNAIDNIGSIINQSVREQRDKKRFGKNTAKKMETNEDDGAIVSFDGTKVFAMIAEQYEPTADFSHDGSIWFMTTPDIQSIIQTFSGVRPSAVELMVHMQALGFKCFFWAEPFMTPDFYWLLKKKIF